MSRTDIHRPAALVTEDYSFIAAFDTQQGIANKPEAYVTWRNDLFAKVFATNDERGMNQCHHCGARMRYTGVLLHTPTGQHIAVGETCMDNRFALATNEFQALRKAAELDRAAHRIVKAVEAFVLANVDLAWLASKDHTSFPFGLATNWFVCDVARKLRQYGDLSERQIEAIRKAAAQAEVRANTPVIEEVLVPVVEGRIVITGTVLTTKWQDSDYGGSLKMLVKDERGFKVWGTVPSSVNVDRGDTITFTATVEAKEGEIGFGFFKRPSKATATPTTEV